jgi:hypothetical protein
LRSIASSLGVGGYNAPAVDAKVFEDKIRSGIDLLTTPLVNQIESLKARVEELTEENRKLREALEQLQCGHCDGLGTVPRRDGAWGKIYEVPCSSCKGTGLHDIAREALKEKHG